MAQDRGCTSSPGWQGRPCTPGRLPATCYPDQPVYGIHAGVGDEAVSEFRPLEAIAVRFVEDLCTFQPEGPICLAGYSFAGMLAYEMARQLASRGRPVKLLAILDTGPGPVMEKSAAGLIRATRGFLGNLPWWIRDDLLADSPRRRSGPGGQGRLAGTPTIAPEPLRFRSAHRRRVCEYGPRSDRQRRQIDANLRAFFDYRRVPKSYPGRVILFHARTRPLFHLSSEDEGWREWASGGVEVRTVPGTHAHMLDEPFVRELAESLQACA